MQVELEPGERRELERIVRAGSSEVRMVLRARKLVRTPKRSE
jgi:hypothetical protein